MKTERLRVLIFGAWALCLLGFAALPGDPVPLRYPENWPAPAYDFSRNPLTRQGIELGRRLFYDPVLSRDSTVSCASCHLSFTAFTHVDHALSHGIKDRVGKRNSPALMNLAWARHFMWDGAVTQLDFQALAPIEHPAEMDNTIRNVVQKLSASPEYEQMFEAAFGAGGVTGERVLKALSQFELTLISADSKYDRVQRGAEQFTEMEQRGYRIFQKNCASCHTEPFFTHFGFEKNGLPADSTLGDTGRMGVTQNPMDSLLFKVPTLRNIEFSQPYMHDGRFKKLREVLNHYAQNPVLKSGAELGPDEKTELLAFLLTLTDRSFLFNPDFSFPRK